jgi:hypothetical protein
MSAGDCDEGAGLLELRRHTYVRAPIWLARGARFGCWWPRVSTRREAWREWWESELCGLPRSWEHGRNSSSSPH